MTDLKTTFAGLSLRNPIIISSSGLTNSAGKNKRLAEAGAGAIVLKSLFEEQIMLEADQLKDPAFYPEASDYLEEYIREHKLAEYLTLIKESKKECSIPIIASINCYSDSEWVDFAKQIQEAGADALEINILALQSDVQYTYGSFEQLTEQLQWFFSTVSTSRTSTLRIWNKYPVKCSAPPPTLPLLSAGLESLLQW